jgi:hypothetical protein
MGAEASTIARAEAADFFCDCWAVKIPSDERVGDVPGGVHCHAQGLVLESFQDFNVKWNLKKSSATIALQQRNSVFYTVHAEMLQVGPVRCCSQ